MIFFKFFIQNPMVFFFGYTTDFFVIHPDFLLYMLLVIHFKASITKRSITNVSKSSQLNFSKISYNQRGITNELQNFDV